MARVSEAPRHLPPVPADEARLRAFNLDQLVRELTAGKGYTPAPSWTLCGTCACPVSNRDSVAIIGGTVHHAVCR